MRNLTLIGAETGLTPSYFGVTMLANEGSNMHKTPDPHTPLLAALATFFLALMLLGACSPGPIDTTGDGYDTTDDDGFATDADAIDAPPDLGTPEDPPPPTTSIVDACCFCDGETSYCEEIDDDTCSGTLMTGCILVTGTDPFCAEFSC